MNQKFQNAIKMKEQKVPPIWFMRQAGRYHKHYQNLRSKYSFMDLCKQPELASEVALGPILDFDFDVSIMFSDLLFPLEAFGMGLDYKPGPVLGWHLNANNIKNLKSVDEALPALMFQNEVAKATRQVLPADKSLIGFVGGPWTLFSYAVDGSHKDGLKQTKKNVDLFNPFCEKLVPLLIKNIQLQLDGGVELVMIFDTAAGEISSSFYNAEVVPQLQKLAKHFPGKLAYYSKGTVSHHYSQELTQSGWAGLGYDHRWDLTKILKSEDKKTFIQGNFDQLYLFQDHQTFKKTLDNYLNSYKELSLKERAGWVCGLGHGVLPETPEENVKYFVNRVREVLGA